MTSTLSAPDYGVLKTQLRGNLIQPGDASYGVDPDPANREKITNWARGYWDAIHPFAAPGAYVNFLMEEGTARVEATYGANYARLQAIKAKHDSENLFRANQISRRGRRPRSRPVAQLSRAGSEKGVPDGPVAECGSDWKKTLIPQKSASNAVI